MNILFVYNSELNAKGLVNDFINEVSSNKEINCSLCDITHSFVFKKRKWKEFIHSLSIDTRFYFKDKFIKKYKIKNNQTFPCVFIYSEGESLKEIISSAELNNIESLGELMNLVENRINSLKNE